MSIEKIIKITPITFNGVDGFEVKVSLLSLPPELNHICGMCMYNDFIEEDETCVDVHYCGYNQRCCFIFVPGTT